MTERKNWNAWGEFVNHEVYDEALNKLVSKEIPRHKKYDYLSVNYHTRKKEERKTLNEMRGPGYYNTGFWYYLKMGAILLMLLIAMIRSCQ
ncbi:MAG: hypothetical protein QM791_08855 [Ferruginibacter sp.]